jgi:Nuclease-related domain
VQRAERERRTSPRLRLDADGVVVLNDRRVPGSKLSIDVIAVSPAGVFVIDAKNHKGLVHTKRLGPFWNLGPDQLHIGRRNCTPSIVDVTKKGDAVRGVLSATSWGAEVPVRAVLCLTRAEWGFAAAVEVGDVLVGWPKLIAAKLHEPVVMDSSTVAEVSEMIGERLPTT